MNDQIDPLVVVGGPPTIQDLVKRYASLKGWKRVEGFSFTPREDGSLGCWSRRTARTILERTKHGDKILIFLPASLTLGWIKTLKAAGRITDIPLYNLSIAKQITTLHRWIAALEPGPQPSSRHARILERIKVSAQFLKRPPGRNSPAPLQDQNKENVA